jgi:uncharacterized surface protein with fasciclin (FAS1) repeats
MIKKEHMKIIYKLKWIALCVVLITMGSSCDDTVAEIGGAEQQYNSAFGMIVANTNLTLFNKAIELTNLKAVLDTNDDYTYFAPSDAAIETYLVQNGYVNEVGPDITLVPLDKLKELVLKHVVKGVKKRVGKLAGVNADYLETGELKTMANDINSDLYYLPVNVTDNVLKVGGSDKPALGQDLYATNGFVNIIENVVSLLPTAPEISGVSQIFASAGDIITISGYNFVQLKSVKFDNTVAEIVANPNRNQIQVKVPANFGSYAFIVVENKFGISLPSSIGVKYLLYGDNFSGAASPLWDGGWSGSQDYQNTENVSRGAYSIKRTNDAAWAGMQIGINDIAVADYQYLKISVFPVKSTKLFISIAPSDPWNTGVSVAVKAGEWNNISIPLADLKADQIGTTIKQLYIQEYSGDMGVIYFDDIGFL